MAKYICLVPDCLIETLSCNNDAQSLSFVVMYYVYVMVDFQSFIPSIFMYVWRNEALAEWTRGYDLVSWQAISYRLRYDMLR